MSEALNDLAAYLGEKLGARVRESLVAYGELTITVDGGDIVDVMNFLRRDAQCQFVSFIDISGVDYPYRDKRFDVVYHLLSPRQNNRIRVKVITDEDTPVPSVTSVFPGADWFEREAYDLYGILFSGHPDLRRLPPGRAPAMMRVALLLLPGICLALGALTAYLRSGGGPRRRREAE